MQRWFVCFFSSVCNKCNGCGYNSQNIIEKSQITENCCVKVDCKYCNGKGRLTFGDACNVCKGSGHALTMYQKIKCGYCNIKGKLSFGDKCVVCKGFGWAFCCA